MSAKADMPETIFAYKEEFNPENGTWQIWSENGPWKDDELNKSYQYTLTSTVNKQIVEVLDKTLSALLNKADECSSLHIRNAVMVINEIKKQYEAD